MEYIIKYKRTRDDRPYTEFGDRAKVCDVLYDIEHSDGKLALISIAPEKEES